MSALAVALELGAEAEPSLEQWRGNAVLVLATYLVVLLGIGYWGWRRGTGKAEDFYLAARSQGWVVSSLTIMATFFSSFALLGAPGLAYKEGVVFVLFALNPTMAGASVYFLGSRIHRLGRALKAVTPGDLLARYYDSPRAMRLLVALIGLLYAVPYVVMQINAGGILSEVLFPGTPHAFEWGSVGLALVTMVYIMVGGMRSVAWSDVLQGLLLLSGMLLAGVATIAALGGLGSFFDRLAELPPRSLSAPGTTGAWTPEKLLTVCVIASLGSMVQPAQWMRFYSAASVRTLRRSAMVFGLVLPVCFLSGGMLVGLGGQALYPLVDEQGEYRVLEAGADEPVRKAELEAGDTLLPHEAVGDGGGSFDRVLVVVLRDHLPELLGPLGGILALLVIVAIMAASMSTADSNLHASSAVLTRDVWKRFVRRDAGEREQAWVGRVVIVGITLVALGLILAGRHNPHFDPVALLVQLGLLAIAFASQLLPATFDVLYLRRGSRAGAVCGVLAGLAVVFLFTPFFSLGFAGTGVGDSILERVEWARPLIDIGTWGLALNVVVFVVVSSFTRRPSPDVVRRWAAIACPVSRRSEDQAPR